MKTKLILVVLFASLFVTAAIFAQEKKVNAAKEKSKTECTDESDKSCCSKEATDTKGPHAGNATMQDKKASKTDSLICPVMNMKAKKEINYTYKGKKYYFCCKDCLAKFKKEPEKYIKK